MSPLERIAVFCVSEVMGLVVLGLWMAYWEWRERQEWIPSRALWVLPGGLLLYSTFRLLTFLNW